VVRRGEDQEMSGARPLLLSFILWSNAKAGLRSLHHPRIAQQETDLSDGEIDRLLDAERMTCKG
jgi:hypothetical protein